MGKLFYDKKIGNHSLTKHLQGMSAEEVGVEVECMEWHIVHEAKSNIGV
jgi:hypothetical protein